MVIPDLDMVVGFNGGNYGEFSKWYLWWLQLVPQYIIPAAGTARSSMSGQLTQRVQKDLSGQ